MKAVEEKGKKFLGVMLSIPHELWGMAANHRLREERRGEERGEEGRGGQDTVCDIIRNIIVSFLWKCVYVSVVKK